MLTRSDLVVKDYETKGIQRRPHYPPKPVGVSLIYPGQQPVYYHWGHPPPGSYGGDEGKYAKNVVMCDEWAAKERIKDIGRSGCQILCHHAKFDIDVSVTHMGMQMPDWDRIHDTMYQIFLEDPHADLSLKPSAERILGLPPEEQDKVKDWVQAHKKQIEQKYGIKFGKERHFEWGEWISEAPPWLVGPYANGDTLRTLKIHKKLMPFLRREGMLGAYDRERQLMPIMLENERQGIHVDLDRLSSDIVMYESSILRVDDWLRKQLKAPGLEFEKDMAVADALEAAGIVTDFVLTPTGKKSVAKDNLTPDMFSDPKIARALGYRNRLKTCLSTFMLPWEKLASANKGFIHTHWNQVRSNDRGGVGARTGRMSCSPNFMNIPTEWYEKNDGYHHPTHLRGLPELPLVRGYIIGDKKNHSFGGRDYNQQELRILAHFENDVLMAEYNANPLLDVHKYVQDAITEIIGYEIPRKAIKVLNFGTIYGMGLGKLAAGMDVDVNTAQRVNDARRMAMPGLKSLEKGIKEGARNDTPIRTWGGRIYFKEEPKLIKGRMVDFGYKLLNYLIQGSAADCTKQAVINYHTIKKEGRFLAQVHDEVNITAPTKAMKAELLLLRDAMLDVKFDVPMLSEPYIGPNWGQVVKYKEAA